MTMRFHFKFLSAFIIFLGATPAYSESDIQLAAYETKSPIMRVYGRSSAPVGYIKFCAISPIDCQRSRQKPGRFELTPARWRELEEINHIVNSTVEPLTDKELYGEVERWSYPKRYGDCEDYVLLKRKLLAQRGWPMSAPPDNSCPRRAWRRARSTHRPYRPRRFSPRQQTNRRRRLAPTALPICQTTILSQSIHVGVTRAQAGQAISRPDGNRLKQGTRYHKSSFKIKIYSRVKARITLTLPSRPQSGSNLEPASETSAGSFFYGVQSTTLRSRAKRLEFST